MAGFENDVMVAKNLNFDESGAKPHLGILNAAGLIPIGTGLSQPSQEILAGSLVSAHGTLTIGYSSPNITIDVAGGSPAVTTIVGDTTGTAIGPTINLLCNTNTEGSTKGCGSTVAFGGDNIHSMSLAIHDSVTSDQIVGNQAGNNSLHTNSGNFNTGFGILVLHALGGGSASQNVGVGYASLTALTNAGSNTAIGTNSLGALLTGSNNSSIGWDSGLSYTGSESSNLIFGNSGTVGDNNTIRIGTQGSGAGQQNKCFIAGIASVSVSNLQFVTINTSTGQLGSSSATSGLFTWTDVTGATQTLAINNGYLTDRGGGVTYTLPATASIGDMIKIVGKSGLATITPNANQQILISSASGTVGASGTAVSTNAGDCINLVCTTSGASTVWRASDLVGSWTLN